MMLALTLLLAQAAAPPPEASPPASTPEMEGELPAAASIRTRRKAESTRPNRLEGSLVTPGRDVSADDIVDEMVDEFAADIARLGAGKISPVLLQRVRVSANMNPEYAQIFEARLAAAVFKAANLALVRCVECTATRSRVEGLEWVVTRGVTNREDARAVARKYGARTFLDVALTLRERPASLSMDVEMVRADDSSIAFAEGYRMDADRAMLYRGADRAQTREEKLKELQDKLDQRPRYVAALEAGMMLVKASSSGAFWGGMLRYRLTERFGSDKQFEAGLALSGFINPDYLAGGILGVMWQARVGDGNAFLPSFWLGLDGGVFLTGNAGNTPIFGGTVRWQVGTRIALHGGLRYMIPFQLRGKGESYGGVTPELGVGFVWN
jgi:hypothetical protein